MKMANCYEDEYIGEICSHTKDIKVRFKETDSHNLVRPLIDCLYLGNTVSRPTLYQNASQYSWDLRSALVDWVIHMLSPLRLREETLSLSINYIIVFLACSTTLTGSGFNYSTP